MMDSYNAWEDMNEEMITIRISYDDLIGERYEMMKKEFMEKIE